MYDIWINVETKIKPLFSTKKSILDLDLDLGVQGAGADDADGGGRRPNLRLPRILLREGTENNIKPIYWIYIYIYIYINV